MGVTALDLFAEMVADEFLRLSGPRFSEGPALEGGKFGSIGSCQLPQVIHGYWALAGLGTSASSAALARAASIIACSAAVGARGEVV